LRATRGRQLKNDIIANPGINDYREIHPIIESLYEAGFSSGRARIVFCSWSCRLASASRPMMSRQLAANYRPLLPATGGRQQQDPPPERRRRNIACERCRIKKTRVCIIAYCSRGFRCADIVISSAMVLIRFAGGVEACSSFVSMRLDLPTRIARPYCRTG
jgi:hypothetical protein